MSINIIALENCPYSIGAVDTLVPNKKNKHDNISIQWVNYNDKHKYKTNDKPTFPQISFNDSFLGGYSQLSDVIKQLQNHTEPCSATSLPYFKNIKDDKDKLRALKIILEAVLGKKCE
jgi:glutaredoxin